MLLLFPLGGKLVHGMGTMGYTRTKHKILAKLWTIWCSFGVLIGVSKELVFHAFVGQWKLIFSSYVFEQCKSLWIRCILQNNSHVEEASRFLTTCWKLSLCWSATFKIEIFSLVIYRACPCGNFHI